jgi:hypothetical protein
LLNDLFQKALVFSLLLSHEVLNMVAVSHPFRGSACPIGIFVFSLSRLLSLFNEGEFGLYQDLLIASITLKAAMVTA